MDQFTSVLGQASHLLLLDCRSTRVQMVPLTDPEVEVLIVNTNVKHELTGGEYAQRRSQCEAAARAMGVPSLRDATLEMLARTNSSLESILQRRARHVIGENDRTTAAAKGLAAGQWEQVGQLMYASHASLRDDYEVSCEELDLLVELAQQHGGGGAVIGSRMTGGGFGGCTVSLVRKDHLERLAAAIDSDYRRLTGIAPSIFTTRPAQGAQIVRA
jgi:galactokinase